ncbi:hypothetical protein DCO58_05540 [Helicobacter saguini]|uniref:Uncharacterized protein n=1 Tax=Helicobacter saguini TaxID=1548018 RepID=A0A347VT97_9HELI|nr:hypothetical protein [Helicobacter saguini]MWV62186.1 hypothetical protein [Helicobacter saguini]MWV67140.1 hypothetical protein [Helicobacter saguini]MWV69492.1 hypothetical protein [Helicobacter saguini]MWV70956.1 hypothetical protein [Helicobacter saguini]TLD92956.1 hypothetical protein LS64_009720 [Helicobacter saguini]
MKYYVTIYIDKLFGEITRNFKISSPISSLDFTHAFLGLTKGKSPNELDKIDIVTRNDKNKNKDIKNIDKVWYERLETSKFNDGFFGFAPIKSARNHCDKMLKNN